MDKEQQKDLLVQIMEADEKDGLYKIKTSVDWLWDISQERELTAEDFEKAKQIHKTEIKQAFESGDRNGFWRYKSVREEDITSEEYYNRNFN